MTGGAEYVDVDAPVQQAATALARNDVGMILVVGAEGRLHGIITDRDIVTSIVAAGRDAATTRVRELFDQLEIVTIGADDDVADALETMEHYDVRRLPVIDGDEVIGIVSQADIVRHSKAVRRLRPHLRAATEPVSVEPPGGEDPQRVADLAPMSFPGTATQVMCS